MNNEIEIISSQILEWFDANEFKTAKGLPFEWYEHEFLIEPLQDCHPEQAYNKCAQVGFSESMIGKVFFLMMYMGLNVLYTLPTDSDAEDFSSQKIDPIINANRELLSKVKGNLDEKQFPFKDLKSEKEYLRFLYIKGTHNTKSKDKKAGTAKGVSFTTDVNFHDEASKSDSFVMEQMRSRYENSKYGWRILFDNPTFPNVGSDKVYQKSDQRHWFVKCTKCNYWQYLDWQPLQEVEFQSGSNHCWVDLDEKEFLCGKCKRPLSEYERRAGKWVARYGHIKDYRGYWINQMMYIHHTPKKLVKKYLDWERSVFFNMVMGMPYLGSDVTISSKVILENITAGSRTLEDNIAIGVDHKATELEYVIKDLSGMKRYGRWKTFDELDLFMATHDNAVCVADAGPLTGPVKTLCEKYKGRMWRARYKPEADQTEIARFSPKSDRSLVLIRREEEFDHLAEKYRLRKMPIIMGVNDTQEFISHYKSLIRITELDSQGNERAKWDGSSGPTDFCHADLYSDIAMIKMRKGSAVNISPTGITDKKDVQQEKSTKELVKKLMEEAKKR